MQTSRTPRVEPGATFAALVSALALCGCSGSEPDTYLVTGVVSYDGNIVPTGMVTFVPNGSGQAASAPIGPDGRFELKTPAGSYKIGVVAPRETQQPESTSRENWIEAFSKAGPQPYVPGRYADPETSRVAYTVEAKDENLFDISIRPLKPRRR